MKIEDYVSALESVLCELAQLLFLDNNLPLRPESSILKLLLRGENKKGSI